MAMKRDITVGGKMSLVFSVRRFFVITAIIISAILPLGGCNLPPPRRLIGAYIPYDPVKYYQADFNTVWDAAIIALHSNSYIIDLMSTREGYISAHSDTGSSRSKVGISISNAHDLVRISINMSNLTRAYEKQTKSYYWMESMSTYYTEWLHKAIASVLD